ncbi:MAG: hypothetical protein Kow0069_16690 [Promethearchaeota archaeon]
MRVERIMSSPVIHVRAKQPLKDVVRLMGTFGISMVVVLAGDGDSPGRDDYHVVTHGDLIRWLLAQGNLDLERTKAADVMVGPALFVRVGDSVDEAVDLMVRKGIKRVLVLDVQDRLAGILTATDVLRFNSEVFPKTTPYAVVVVEASGVPLFSKSFPACPPHLVDDVTLLGGSLKLLEMLSAEGWTSGGPLVGLRKDAFDVLLEPRRSFTAVLVVDHASVRSRKRLREFADAFEREFRQALADFREPNPPPVSRFAAAGGLATHHFLEKGEL